MKVNSSALRHGISEPDILWAAENWAYASDPDEDVGTSLLSMPLRLDDSTYISSSEHVQD